MAASRGFAWLLVAGIGLPVASCATADLRPGAIRHESPRMIRQKFHGPDVSIRAMHTRRQNSMAIQPTMSLKDSAYVVVGDIGDDGTLRILFPASPGEPSLVAKTKKLELPPFIPRVYFPMGAVTTVGQRTAISGSGAVFVIASSLPLQLHKLAEGDKWSLFDVYYQDWLNPNDAITDLAAAISTDVSTLSIAHSKYQRAMLTGGQARSSGGAPATTRRLPRPPS
jgi:hypothetical protein